LAGQADLAGFFIGGMILGKHVKGVWFIFSARDGREWAMSEAKSPEKMLAKLVALKVSNGALAAKELPGRLKVLGWGRNEATSGAVILDEVSARLLPGNQREAGFEDVVVDFEHNTVEGAPEWLRTSEPRDVAGYGRVEVVPGEGLYLANVAWTPSGERSARNYADLSPAVYIDEERRVLFLHSVGLCRNGAVYDLTFYSAAGRGGNNQRKTMNETGQQYLTLTALGTALGLAEGSDPPAIETGLKEALGGLRTLAGAFKDGKLAALGAVEERLTALEAGRGSFAALTATIDGQSVELKIGELVKLAARVDQLEAQLKQASEAALNAERGQLVARFAAEGKAPRKADGGVYSVAELGALDLATLKVLHANTPATVPLAARARAGAKEGAKPRTTEEMWNG
jgi:hypothetical protein